jgi:hypothetical protein
VLSSLVKGPDAGTMSTKLPNKLNGANRVAEGQDGFLFPGVVFSLRFSISQEDPMARWQPFSRKRIWVGLHYSIARGCAAERCGPTNLRTVTHESARLRIEETT